ncbi:MAG: PIN domain-containing protein [Deltaproteobacteria bacterium]|nr:PIN domain-containing protein [Deltaproteobacteria bacterium]
MSVLVVDASVWVSAADSSDAFHAASRAFLRSAVSRRQRFVLPAFARLEIACALARRLQNATRGRALATTLVTSPLVVEQQLDHDFLQEALERGTGALLRGSDALYATAAAKVGGTLITWDKELLRRAHGKRPTDWTEEEG